MCIKKGKVYIGVCVCLSMVNWMEEKAKAKEMIFYSIKNATNKKVPVDKEKLISVISAEIGFKKNKVNEFINDLVILGNLRYDGDGFLWFVKEESENTKEEVQKILQNNQKGGRKNGR